MNVRRLLMRSIYRTTSLFPLLLITPVLPQSGSHIVQTTSTIRGFIGSVAVRRAGATTIQPLVKGDAGMPVEPGTEVQVGPNSSLTLKCASGQVKHFKGPLTVKVSTECPPGEPVARLGLGVSGMEPQPEPAPMPEPEPIRGLW